MKFPLIWLPSGDIDPDMLPSLFRKIIIPEDWDIWDSHYHDSRQELKPREIQFRIQARDGQIRWIEHSCQPVTGDQGGLRGFRASNRDITSRKQAEIDLREAYTKIEQLKNQLEAETAYLQAEIKLEHNFESIIGNSAAIQYVLYKVEQIAATDSWMRSVNYLWSCRPSCCGCFRTGSLSVWAVPG